MEVSKRKIVCIGGGTGLSVMLRRLKNYFSDITAVVTVADDGGGSGILRNDLKMLPPGDIRQCIIALSESEPFMKELLMYRFCEGSLSGQSFGNLFLAAMNEISGGNFVDAVKRVSDVLRVKGRVLPVTEKDVRLNALMKDGTEVCGESNIGHATHEYGQKISKVFLTATNEGEKISPLPEVVEAIEEADLIILGPGSLYTSVIPNLLVPGVASAINSAKAQTVYISNIMTQPGETDGYTAYDHLKAIIKHSSEGFVDWCILNRANPDEKTLEKYENDGAKPVCCDTSKIEEKGIKVIKADLLSLNENGLVRHNSRALAEEIVKLAEKI